MRSLRRRPSSVWLTQPELKAHSAQICPGRTSKCSREFSNVLLVTSGHFDAIGSAIFRDLVSDPPQFFSSRLSITETVAAGRYREFIVAFPGSFRPFPPGCSRGRIPVGNPGGRAELGVQFQLESLGGAQKESSATVELFASPWARVFTFNGWIHNHIFSYCLVLSNIFIYS